MPVECWFNTPPRETTRERLTRAFRELMERPDVSATHPDHLIGFKDGWRAAVRRALDELPETD